MEEDNDGIGFRLMRLLLLLLVLLWSVVVSVVRVDVEASQSSIVVGSCEGGDRDFAWFDN